jgi:hypothetical protein
MLSKKPLALRPTRPRPSEISDGIQEGRECILNVPSTQQVTKINAPDEKDGEHSDTEGVSPEMSHTRNGDRNQNGRQ